MTPLKVVLINTRPRGIKWSWITHETSIAERRYPQTPKRALPSALALKSDELVFAVSWKR